MGWWCKETRDSEEGHSGQLGVIGEGRGRRSSGMRGMWEALPSLCCPLEGPGRAFLRGSAWGGTGPGKPAAPGRGPDGEVRAQWAVFSVQNRQGQGFPSCQELLGADQEVMGKWSPRGGRSTCWGGSEAQGPPGSSFWS